jgi:autotransporter-associated beta strand protein
MNQLGTSASLGNPIRFESRATGRHRRSGRARASRGGAIAAAAAAVFATLTAGDRAARAGTQASFTGADSGNPFALDDGNNYDPNALPGPANDVVIDNSFANLTAGATLTYNSSVSATQAYSSLNVNTSSAIDIYNLVSNASGSAMGTSPTVTITLGGSSSTNSYAPNPADLLYVAAGSSLTFNSSATNANYGLLTISLGQAGNFDIAGVANISAPIASTVGVTKTGTGTLTISNSQAFTGGLTIAAGTVAVGSSTYLGAATSITTIQNGSILSFTNTTLITGPSTKTFVLSGGGEIDAAVTTTVAGVISGTGGLVKGGPGILTLSPETLGTTTLTSNTYAGGTTVTSGTLQFATQNALPAGVVTLDAGTALTDINTTTAGTFMAGVTLNLAGAATFNESTAAKTFTIAGAIGGPGSLTKAGNGTLYLTASNSYAGGTFLNTGTTRANNLAAGGLATGSGTVTINSGATLGGNGSVGAVVVNSGGNISGGSTGSVPATLNTGAETWNAGGGYLVAFNLASGTTTTVGLVDKLVMSGLSVTGGPFNVTVSALNASTGTASLPAGSSLVLADDTDPTAANPFNTSGGTTFASLSALQATLTLSAGTGIASATGSPLQLDTAPDGTGGYDLLLDAAAPEPTSLLLLGMTAAPIALGRRRGRRGGAVG